MSFLPTTKPSITNSCSKQATCYMCSAESEPDMSKVNAEQTLTASYCCGQPDPLPALCGPWLGKETRPSPSYLKVTHRARSFHQPRATTAVKKKSRARTPVALSRSKSPPYPTCVLSWVARTDPSIVDGAANSNDSWANESTETNSFNRKCLAPATRQTQASPLSWRIARLTTPNHSSLFCLSW